MSLTSVISAGAAGMAAVVLLAAPTTATARTAGGVTPADHLSPAGIVVVIGIGGGTHHDCGFCGLGD